MTQPDLFATESIPIEFVRDGMLHRRHLWGEERNFQGYRQTRLNGERKWMFYICSFGGPKLSDGSDGTGNVLLFDGRTERCRMDTRSRVLISGHWYNHSKWDH